MPRRRYKRVSQPPGKASVTGINHDGCGVATIEGKVTFIQGALPEEEVVFAYHSRHARYDEGQVVEVLTSSEQRVTPICPHFLQCGGCHLQHMSQQAQVRHKESVLLEQLAHFGNVQAPSLAPAIMAKTPYGYRRKARLGVRYVAKKGRLLVGFREKNGRYLADMQSCAVLHPSIGERLDDLSDLLGHLDGYQHIPQVEVAVGDEGLALIIRHLLPLSSSDINQLVAFGSYEQIRLYLQPGGEETVHMIWPEEGDGMLHYTLAKQDVTLAFYPTDFIQVNAEVNERMVDQALDWLALTEHDHVLDLFSGIGNFGVPIAKAVAKVTAVEGCPIMTKRIHTNADNNGVNNLTGYTYNLLESPEQVSWLDKGINKVVLDPPRSGAQECLPWLIELGPERILYVSCHQASFARDAGLLVAGGYRLDKLGVMDMFTHTAHIETMALFVKKH